MYLSRIHIQDFRILKDIELRFQPPVGKSDGNNGNVVNVIAGVNGCGKTTLLDHYNLYSTQAMKAVYSDDAKRLIQPWIVSV